MTQLKIPNLNELCNQLTAFARLKHEYGSSDVSHVLNSVDINIREAINKIQSLENDNELELSEPDKYECIIKLRTSGPRKIFNDLNIKSYRNKLLGALYARSAGCTLGAIVENWSIEDMRSWAEYANITFPPTDYWSAISNPHKLRYNMSRAEEYTRTKMKGIPVDDDTTYTLLGLLIAEEYGVNFSTEDVGKAWIQYLPMACTAEAIALENLKNGIIAKNAADFNNPYCQWIGADIRSDPWAYIAPGWPEKAAHMAYRDAYISHRRNGIYGAMFFSAAQSAAFAVDNPIDALKIGLTEIPKTCSLYNDIIWALENGSKIKNYQEARQAVDERFKGMHSVHTQNNACLTIFGLMIGGNDVTKVLSETVAMGLDNDCNAATAGSIVGAISGFENIPDHWIRPFNNKIYSYMIDNEEFLIDDVINRFTKQAELLYKTINQ